MASLVFGILGACTSIVFVGILLATSGPSLSLDRWQAWQGACQALAVIAFSAYAFQAIVRGQFSALIYGLIAATCLLMTMVSAATVRPPQVPRWYVIEVRSQMAFAEIFAVMAICYAIAGQWAMTYPGALAVALLSTWFRNRARLQQPNLMAS
jgi:hypothetical protein